MGDRHGPDTVYERRSTPEIIQDIVSNLREIVRSEFQLARTEAGQKGKRLGKAAAMLAAGGAIAAAAALLAVAACTAALAAFLPVWTACLIMAALLGAIGGGVLAAGRRRLRRTSVVPEQTISSLKEDVEWLKRRTR